MGKFYIQKIFVNKSVLIGLLVSFLFSITVLGQTETNKVKLLEFAKRKSVEYKNNREAVEKILNKHGYKLRYETDKGRIIEVQKLVNGIPQYYSTENIDAAKTTRTDKLWTSPFNETGSGYNKLGEWDGGGVLLTHQEFGGRVTQEDSPPSGTSTHSTHVAGTMIAAGVAPNAKGMAYEGLLKAWEWTDDEAEMATAAAAGLEISNHSYGYVRGWNTTFGDKGLGNYWYGAKSISTVEDYGFGFYDTGTKDIDQIAYDAPFYLIVKSAGNDRGEAPFGGLTNYWWDDTAGDWVTIPAGSIPENDGGTSGYDCIGTKGIAKNILTIGAVKDVANYTGPSDVVMTSFSSWGPADDGRIKPDIVANGDGLYSCSDAGNDQYTTMSGTSMSSPNTSGTLALLQDYYQKKHSFQPMRAATLKALVIHTADEAGNSDGPDYGFGWGLLNAEKAAQVIDRDVTVNNSIDELVLSNGTVYTRNVTVDGSEPLVVTIVWTDVPGTPVAASLDPSNPMLVNDLDLKITNGSTTYYPWKLDSSNPSAAATNVGPNHVDNVEKVEIANPVAGNYTVEVSNSGTLVSDQAFSIIISGDTTPLGVLADIKVMLEGPFDPGTSNMNTTLNSNNDIPLTSPYSEDSRTVSSIPADVVDWILVQLRDTPTGSAITSKSAFLRNDGIIVGDDGTSKIKLSVSAGDYYIVIKHRNHLAIMSANKVALPNSTIYDFTTGSDKYYGTGGSKQLN